MFPPFSHKIWDGYIVSKKKKERYRVVQSITKYYKVLQRQRKNLAHLLRLIFGLVCIWMYIFPWFMFSNPEKWANICLHRSGHSTTFCFLQHLQRENLENIASAFLCKFLFNMSTVFNMLSWYYQTLYQGGRQILLGGFFFVKERG